MLGSHVGSEWELDAIPLLFTKQTTCAKMSDDSITAHRVSCLWMYLLMENMQCLICKETTGALSQFLIAFAGDYNVIIVASSPPLQPSLPHSPIVHLLTRDRRIWQIVLWHSSESIVGSISTAIFYGGLCITTFGWDQTSTLVSILNDFFKCPLEKLGHEYIFHWNIDEKFKQ